MCSKGYSHCNSGYSIAGSRQSDFACEGGSIDQVPDILKVFPHRQKLLAILSGQLVDQGRNHAAGAAPRGPEVHQDRHLGLEHLDLEC